MRSSHVYKTQPQLNPPWSVREVSKEEAREDILGHCFS